MATAASSGPVPGAVFSQASKLPGGAALLGCPRDAGWVLWPLVLAWGCAPCCGAHTGAAAPRALTGEGVAGAGDFVARLVWRRGEAAVVAGEAGAGAVLVEVVGVGVRGVLGAGCGRAPAGCRPLSLSSSARCAASSVARTCERGSRQQGQQRLRPRCPAEEAARAAACVRSTAAAPVGRQRGAPAPCLLSPCAPACQGGAASRCWPARKALQFHIVMVAVAGGGAHGWKYGCMHLHFHLHFLHPLLPAVMRLAGGALAPGTHRNAHLLGRGVVACACVVLLSPPVRQACALRARHGLADHGR